MSSVPEPAQIVARLSDVSLFALAAEFRSLKNLHKPNDMTLADLAERLASETGIPEEGSFQVAEALVLIEVCDRWLKTQRH
jgi:hypothetical protein